MRIPSVNLLNTKVSVMKDFVSGQLQLDTFIHNIPCVMEMCMQ